MCAKSIDRLKVTYRPVDKNVSTVSTTPVTIPAGMLAAGQLRQTQRSARDQPETSSMRLLTVAGHLGETSLKAFKSC